MIVSPISGPPSPISKFTKQPKRDLYRIEEGKLRLSLHPGQLQAWRSERRFVAIIAGTQSGKTSFLPWWLAREIERCGSGDYIAATSSYDLFKLKFLPSIRNVFEHLTGMGRYWAAVRVIELADPDKGFLAKRADDQMWGRIILRSASAGGGLESATANAAVLDEAGQDEFTVEDWEAVLRRLSLSEGRVLIGTTPYNLGWMKTQVYDRWAKGDADYDVIQFESTMNPIFPKSEYDRALRSMPSWRFDLMYRGRFTRPAGLIYDCFQPDVHIVDPFPVHADWWYTVGMDFGAVNTALLWLAYDREADRYFVVEESLEGGQSTPQHAAKARKRAEGRRVIEWWGGAGSEDQQRMDWQAEQVPVKKPPVKEVEAGIERVYRMFQEGRLLIFRTCSGLIDELGSYRRKLDENSEPTEIIEDKRKFHRLDGLRYAAVGIAGDPEENPLAGSFLVGSARGWSPK